jgi:putative flippase GtrA
MNEIREFIDKNYDKYLKYELFQIHKKIIIYFVFGSVAALVDLVVYLILYNIFDIEAVISTIISISLATVVGFVLNALINFKVNDKLLLRFASYSATSGIGMAISSLMLYVLHDLEGLDGNIIKIISLPIVFVVQYFINSRISFRKMKS